MRRSVAAESSFLLVTDIQERLVAAMFNKDEVLKNSLLLLKAASELSVPSIVTEQYPKGIGTTLPELKALLPEDTPILEKTEFSCVQAPGFSDAYLNLSFDSGVKDTAVLFGLETHICVLGTVLDMLDKYKLNIIVAADACGARSRDNHELALEAMRSLGCLVLPSESVIYQMLGRSDTPQFKTLLPLLK